MDKPSFIYNVNKLANTLESALKELRQIKIQVEQYNNEAKTAKNDAEQASSEATDAKQTVLTQIGRKATTTELGSVLIATNDDITRASSDKVITSQQLKTNVDNILKKFIEATESELGLVKYASIEDIQNQTGKGVVTAETLKEYAVSLNLTDYYTNGSINGLQYSILKMSETEKYLLLYGKIDYNGINPIKIVFPERILTATFGIGCTPYQHTNNTIVNDLSDAFVSLIIQDDNKSNIEGTSFITIQAKIDTLQTPSAPSDVKVTAEGDNIHINWEA